MIRAILRFVEWLDKRFPPEVTITVEAFNAIQAREHKHSKEIASLSGDFFILRDQAQALEKSVVAIKDAISKGAAPAIAAEKSRADFIATGRMPE